MPYSLKNRDILFLFIFIRTLLFLFTVNKYGYHHDEFLSLAASSHLQLSYLAGSSFYHWFLALSRFIFGDSLFAIRISVPFLSGLILYLVYKIQLEIDDRIEVVSLTLFLTSTTPFFLGMTSYFNEHLFDQVVWLSAIYNAILFLKQGKDKYLLYLVIFLGFGVLVRLTIIWLAAFLLLSFLFTKKIALSSKFIWIGILLMIFAALPQAIWQHQHDWPIRWLLDDRANPGYIYLWKNIIANNLFVQNPLSIPVWLAGIFSIRKERSKKIQPILFTIYSIFLFVLFVKPSEYNVQYIAVLFPVLFTFGAPDVIDFIKKRRSIKRTYIAFLIVFFAFPLPISTPVLSLKNIQSYISMIEKLGITKLSPLPPHFAMMVGWQGLDDHVESIYTELSESGKGDLLILSNELGVAGALSFYGKETLPSVASWHHEFWIWNETISQDERVLFVNVDSTEVAQMYSSITVFPSYNCELCRWRETTPIIFAEHPIVPLEEIWLKKFRP